MDRDARIAKEQEFAKFLRDLAREESNDKSRRLNRAVALGAGRDALFLSQLEGVAAKLAKKIARAPQGYSLESKQSVHPVERDLTLNLGDLHFGANLDGREVPTAYGPHEEARRLAAVVLQTAEYKEQYRKETTLLINILGDIIQNCIHDPRDGTPLAQQVMAATDYLVQAITFLASRFPKVVVRTTPGNHGRNKARHEKKAIHQKWDAIENMIYHSVQLATKHLPNVVVEWFRTPYYTYQSFDNHVFVTHGDTVFNAGNPGSSINIGRIETKINQINATRKDRERFNLFIVGHVHVSSLTQLNNGATVMTNPALIPGDAFTVSLGMLKTACGQHLFESVEGHPVGDFRVITVDENTDKDRSLEKIIRPFTL